LFIYCSYAAIIKIVTVCWCATNKSITHQSGFTYLFIGTHFITLSVKSQHSTWWHDDDNDDDVVKLGTACVTETEWCWVAEAESKKSLRWKWPGLAVNPRDYHIISRAQMPQSW